MKSIKLVRESFLILLIYNKYDNRKIRDFILHSRNDVEHISLNLKYL